MDKPDSPQKLPYVLEVEPGTYAWCSCGKSDRLPFCDGRHSGTAFVPVIEEITEKKTVAWCGCRESKRGAFCDGSHSQL